DNGGASVAAGPSRRKAQARSSQPHPDHRAAARGLALLPRGGDKRAWWPWVDRTRTGWAGLPSLGLRPGGPHRSLKSLACLGVLGIAQDGARVGRRDERAIAPEPTAGERALRRPRLRDAPGNRVIVELDVDAARGDVDADDVAVPQRGDRPAACGLRRHVADGDAAAAATEPAVRDQRDALAQAHAGNRAGRGEHLLRAGAAPRALVPDDDGVAGADATVEDGGLGFLLALEDLAWAPEPPERLIDRAGLDHGPFRRQVPEQDGEPAPRLERLLQRADDGAVAHFGAGNVLAEGLARHGHLVEVEDAL